MFPPAPRLLLLDGCLSVVFDGGATLLSLTRDGKLRILVVASKHPNSTPSEIPTIAESGLGNFDAPAWVGH